MSDRIYYEQDRETLGGRVADTLEVNPETYPLVFGIVSRALGMDPLPPGIIPPDATFTVRRDIEYLAQDMTAREHEDNCPYPESEDWEDCECDDPNYCHPNYAAPWGLGIGAETLRKVNPVYDDEKGDPEQGYGWMRSGDDEPIESDWCGADQFVRAYRWDWYGVTIPQLEVLASFNDWESEYGMDPLMGYLDFDGMHPAVSIHCDGMDWNMGGWTPVFIAVDYIVLD